MYALAAAVTLAAGLLVWRRRGQNGLLSLAWMMFGSTLWALACACEMLAASAGTPHLFVTLQGAGLAVGIIAALDFAVRYPQASRLPSKPLRALIAAPVALFVLLLMTNEWHHLMYSGAAPSPTYPYLWVYRLGFAHHLLTAYLLVLMLAAVGILAIKAALARPPSRAPLAILAGSLMLPLVAYPAYLAAQDSPAMASLLPVSFALNGLLVTAVVFADLERSVREHSHRLQAIVTALQAEINQRIRLESELRASQASLAQRLSAQNHSLSALYDVILLGNQPQAGDEAPREALAKIRSLTGAAWTGLYRRAEGALQCEIAEPPASQNGMAPTVLPDSWLPSDPESLPVVEPATSGLALPVQLQNGGALLARPLSLPEGRPGALLACWPAGRAFSVEDIALFDAAADLLSVILHNLRLREVETAQASREERRRLARELHDSVTQSLHSLALSAETARRLTDQGRQAELADVLDHLALSARQAFKEMRLLLYELRLVPLERIPLAEALQARLDAVERRAGLQADVDIARDACWPREWERELYPIAMEALNNALKHARAGQVRVCLSRRPEGLELSVSDDGCGFDPRAVSSGLGLTSMAERAARLGGILSVDSVPGRGTRISATIPSQQP